MSEPELPAELLKLLMDRQDRNMREIKELLFYWPNFRKHIAFGDLGAAIGFADMMGCDVEGFLRKMRATEPKPTPIEPGPRSAS